MKKILAICLIVMIVLPAFAENKHVLRIGAGATSVNDPDYYAVYGPLLSVEYQYNFSGMQGFIRRCSCPGLECQNFLMRMLTSGGAVGMMITPLPNLPQIRAFIGI